MKSNKPFDTPPSQEMRENARNESPVLPVENTTGNFYPVVIKNKRLPIDLPAIFFIQADGRYSDICLADGRVLKVCKNLGHVEKELKNKGFMRCHKSYLVNVQHIVSLHKSNGGYIEMRNGTHIEISRRRRRAVFSQ